MSDEVREMVERLRERTALRYMGDCKCGKCRLVPREMIDEAADLLARVAAERDAWKTACEGLLAERETFKSAEAALAEARALIERWCWAYDARSPEALDATRDETNAWLYPEGK